MMMEEQRFSEARHVEEDSDSEDIADQYHTLTELSDSDIPPRAPSRMGFNGSAASPQSSDPQTWTRGLFHDDSDDDDLDDDHDVAMNNILSSRRFCASSSSLDSSDSDDDSEDLDSDMSDDSEFDLAELVPQITLIQRSHVEKQVPFSEPRPEPSSSRHSFSRLPSPLSPRQNSQPQTSPLPPLRHNYTHRGYSRNGLHQVKWFWANREEDWAEQDLEQQAGLVAYAGIATRRPILPASSPIPSTSRQSIQRPPPLSVHPRRGDIVALRDPYCAQMDRYFFSMPLWTISKALWMFDIHLAVEGRNRAEARARAESSSESDDSDMELSILSDDSDVTLVESDGDSDQESDHKGKEVEDGYTLATQSKLVSSASSSSHKPRSKPFHRNSPATATYIMPWQTNWYRRLEVLLQLARYDKERQRSTSRTTDTAVRC
ncbi:hypothetical protein C8J56DRAFT_175496 [Mycena floridula]|nr:hypothetical protein C8J56DRAFT_175496 [Mycena floridula]